ncbi:MAG: zinc-binding dehydrogenase [Deltaproteobacteria bacterium]|nr:MAG: zinc-binding dehydrogenase [Deltaproteobacteria bacterium]
MQQIWITKPGPPEVLQVRDAPDPTPGSGEVRIRVRAAGINFADLMARVGLYPDAPKVPCVVGYEVSGVIDAIGSGVTRFAVGDRVFGMPRFGGYTDTLVISEAQVFRMPDAMSFEEAAAMPVVYLTAHHMMLFTGNLRRGSRVLVHSAAGGVGLAAIDLARSRDCEIYGIAGAAKHDFLRQRGCQHPIDSAADYVAEVTRATGGKGVDLVLDPVGGKSWSQGYSLLAPVGRLVAFGLSAAASGRSPVWVLGIRRMELWRTTGRPRTRTAGHCARETCTRRRPASRSTVTAHGRQHTAQSSTSTPVVSGSTYRSTHSRQYGQRTRIVSSTPASWRVRAETSRPGGHEIITLASTMAMPSCCGWRGTRTSTSLAGSVVEHRPCQVGHRVTRNQEASG